MISWVLMPAQDSPAQAVIAIKTYDAHARLINRCWTKARSW